MLSVTMTINGRAVSANVDDRTLLLEFVRDVAGLTGTKNGCLEARCGCCTVLVDQRAIKSCNVLAAAVDGAAVTTIEGLIDWDAYDEENQQSLAPQGTLTPLQQAFWDHGAVQCGYCTPGMVLTITDLLAREPRADEGDVRRAISGNLCRCTGYQKIIDAALAARDTLALPAEAS